MAMYNTSTVEPLHGLVKGVIGRSLPEVDIVLDLSVMDKFVVDFLSPFHQELQNVSDDPTLRTLMTQYETKSVSGQSLKYAYVDKLGRSILYAAVQNHRNDLVKSILQSGVSVESKTKSGYTALHAASGRNNTEIVEWLTSSGANVNATSNDGTAPLHLAAYNGNSKMVEYFVQQTADVDIGDNAGRTPLMAASQQGQLDTVKTLVGLKADVTKTNNSGQTALFYAVMKRHQKVVEFLLQQNGHLLAFGDIKGRTVFQGCAAKGDVQMAQLLKERGAVLETESSDGTNALMAATKEGHEGMVNFLIDAGASVMHQDHLGNTVLMYAIYHGHSDLVNRLTSFENLINTANKKGNTPLIVASTEGDLGLISLLIDKGAQIDAKNNDGATALMAASVEGYADVVQLLVEKGASVTMQSPNGLTPLMIAEAKKHDSVVAILNSKVQDRLASSGAEIGTSLLLAIETGNIPMMEKLMKRGVDVNWRDEQGVTLLMQACLNTNLEAVKILLRRKPDIHQENINGVTAIGYALQGNNIHIIDLLLGCGANFNTIDNKGYTLLHNTVIDGAIDIVKQLARLGADLDARDSHGKTAVMHASEKGHTDIVTYLTDSGADVTVATSDGLDAHTLAFIGEHHGICAILQKKISQCNSNMQFGSTQRAAFKACKHSNLSKVSQLVQQNEHLVNCRDPKQDGKALIHIAAGRGWVRIVDLLCKHGSDINLRSFSGCTAIRQASFHGHLEVVTLLAGLKANVNIADTNGRTPLMCASQEGFTDIVEVLLKNRCLVNPVDRTGRSAALSFALWKNHLDIARMLLRHHANPDVRDEIGHTPLSKQSLSGNLSVVELLTHYGADVNNIDFKGRTPLMAASGSGALAVVMHLVSKGANTEIVDEQGQTAASYASSSGHQEVVNFLISARSSSGDVYNPSTYDPNTVSIGAGTHSNESTDKIIQLNTLKSTITGSDTEISQRKSGSGRLDTSVNEQLQTAVIQGNGDMVKELLLAGASVNYQDKDGCTPLMHAVKHNEVPMIKLLLQFRADIQIVDKQGDDVFQHASGNDHVMSALINLVTGTDGAEDDISVKATSIMYPEEEDVVITETRTFLNAITTGNVNLIQTYLEVGHVTHSTDSELRNAVFHCSLNHAENGIKILKMLYSQNIDINCTDTQGTTPLLNSVLADNQAIALLLIDYGADMNIANNYGETVLMECCVRDNPQVLDCLLRRKAELNQNNILTALIFALINSLEELCKVFQRHQCTFEALWQLDISDMYRLAPCDPVIMRRLKLECSHSGHQDQRNVSVDHHTLQESVSAPDNEELSQLLVKVVTSADRGNPTGAQCQVIVLDIDTCSSGIEGSPEADGVNQPAAEDTNSKTDSLNVAYRLLSAAVLKHDPKYIKGFSKDSDRAKIYVYINEGADTIAERFVRENVTNQRTFPSNNPFEYIPTVAQATFLVGGNPAESSNIVQGGSPLAEMTEDELHNLQVSHGQVSLVERISPFCSLTCFMADADGQIWGVTAGHTFLNLQNNNPNERTNKAKNKVIVSDGRESNRLCVLSSSKFSTVQQSEIDNVQKFVDVAVFPLSQECQEKKEYTTQLFDASPKLFRGEDDDLLHMEIIKIGAATGVTTGQIIDIDHTTTLGSHFCSGFFVIASLSSDLPFARPGDSGAPVIDPSTGHILGLVCGSVNTYFVLGQWYNHVVFGIRLDHCIRHIERSYNISLSLRQDESHHKAGNQTTSLTHQDERDPKQQNANAPQESETTQDNNQELARINNISKKLEAENQELKRRVHEMERKLEEKVPEKGQASKEMLRKGLISIDSCHPGEVVVLHQDCLDPLGLTQGHPRPNKVLAEVITREFCPTRQVWHVRCKPWSHDVLHSNPVTPPATQNTIEVTPELLSLINSPPFV